MHLLPTKTKSISLGQLLFVHTIFISSGLHVCVLFVVSSGLLILVLVIVCIWRKRRSRSAGEENQIEKGTSKEEVN